jgi:hypothetical protein
MTHFIKVSIVIVLVTIVFFNSSVIENIVDPSYNEYDYLRKIRRTHNVVENDTEDKGWQDDGTFKSWYQKGNGSENDKYLNNITPNTSIATTTSIDSKVESPHITVNRLNQPSNHVTNNDSNKVINSNTTNVLPYALLFLLIIIISIIVYVKYH